MGLEVLIREEDLRKKKTILIRVWFFYSFGEREPNIRNTFGVLRFLYRVFKNDTL